MKLRHAEPRDASGIAAIWNRYIRDTSVTFTTDEKTDRDIHAFLQARAAGPLAVFVASEEDRVIGFAATSPFRSGPGYIHTLESSVMLSAEAQKRGVGTALMGHLEDHARQAGAHVLVAGISGENAAAIAFHAHLGFEQVGQMPQVGRKFGRWIDLVLMQKTL